MNDMTVATPKNISVGDILIYNGTPNMYWYKNRVIRITNIDTNSISYVPLTDVLQGSWVAMRATGDFFVIKMDNPSAVYKGVCVGDILVHRFGDNTQFWYEGRKIIVTGFTAYDVCYWALSDTDRTLDKFVKTGIDDFFVVHSQRNMVESVNTTPSTVDVKCSVSRLNEIELDIVELNNQIAELKQEKEKILGVLTVTKNELGLIISKFKH